MRLSTPLRRNRRTRGAAVLIAVLGVAFGAVPAVAADPIGGGGASGFGASVSISGQTLVPPTPSAEVKSPTADDSHTTINVPAKPIVVNGTLIATANVHAASDITSGLTVVKQTLAGPYNARGLGQIENLAALYQGTGASVPLLSAAVLRAEAAAVCSAGTMQYTASSEIIDLAIAGNPVPLNAPVQSLIDGISGALKSSGLNALVDVQRNVVTKVATGGIGVDALVVNVLSAAGANPLARIRLGHAEVGSASCAAPVSEVLPFTGATPWTSTAGLALLAVGGAVLVVRRRRVA